MPKYAVILGEQLETTFEVEAEDADEAAEAVFAGEGEMLEVESSKLTLKEVRRL